MMKGTFVANILNMNCYAFWSVPYLSVFLCVDVEQLRKICMSCTLTSLFISLELPRPFRKTTFAYS